jgi:L-rhamnose-proton symport protein (RhaT)
MIAPDLQLGVGFHALGALLSANCYAPQKYVKRWSWEIFWMTQAAWCWLLWPIIGAAGIAVCGLAGRFKERDLDAANGQRGEFSLFKGLILSLVAGVLSAVYGFALEMAAPIADLAEQHGAGIWKGNVSYLFANTGAFVTALLYSLYLARKSHTLGELRKLPAGSGRSTPSRVGRFT